MIDIIEEKCYQTVLDGTLRGKGLAGALWVFSHGLKSRSL